VAEQDGPADTVDNEAQVTRYEELRCQVTDAGGGHRLGLALFQREGMKAWLDAWSDCGTGTAVRTPRRAASDDFAKHLNLGGDVDGVVRLLAGMAMGTLQPEVRS
jgi:hypothetical protein